MKSKALVIESAVQLRELATEIQDRYALCEQKWRTAAEHAQAMLEHAQAIGEKLIAAKKLAGHGRWESWAKSTLPFSIDKAERMMRLHKNWDRIKSAPEPILGIKQGIAYLAAEKKKAKQDKLGAGDGDADGRVEGGRTSEAEDDHESRIEDEDEDAVEDGADNEPQSGRDCYLDSAEADLFNPEQPLDEDAFNDLESTLDDMEQSLADMLDHDAVASLSDCDPLKVDLIRLQRAMEQFSAGLERKRPIAEDEAAVQCVNAAEEMATWEG